MIPVYQTVHGPQGNCYAACLASILEIDLASIPEEVSRQPRRLRQWLGLRGWTILFGLKPAPPGYAISGRRLRDGSIHAVVCLDGKIVHDPEGRPFARPEDPVVLWTVLEQP